MVIGKRGNKLSPQHPEWHKRQARWRHNAHIGSAAMMLANCNSIITSSTTTEESKETARKIATLAAYLRETLKTRKPGT